MRSSKDLAKRLRFEPFPRGDRFRRSYWLVCIAATLVGVGLWVVFNRTRGARQYLPGPVSQAHATFGDRCERCHQPFQVVQNAACVTCHAPRAHSKFDTRSPRCAECHVEHRGDLLLVSNARCVSCHAQLVTTRVPPDVHATIASFAAHPPFRALRPGESDTAAIRFNHRIHLTSDKIAPADKLSCATCHRADGAGARMRPIRFERDCKRCHKQEVQGPVGSIEALHATPERVRADLMAQLAAIGIRDADAIFAPPSRPLPGVRAAPIDESRTLREYQSRWLERLEGALYRPLQEPPAGAAVHGGLLEANKYCFLCHLSDESHASGDAIAIKRPRIPRRWLAHSEFSHRAHDLLACTACHAHAESSELTSDTNLPAKERCITCHVDAAVQSAGTDCVLCHLYHDTSKKPALRRAGHREFTIDVLTGKAAPPAAAP